VDRVSHLLGQLSGLVDRSVDHVQSAQRTLSAGVVVSAAEVAIAERHLHVVAESLDQMGELVHAAMQGVGVPLGSPMLTRARPVTLGEAVQHAVDVCMPLARRERVELAVNIAPGVGQTPAGAMYTVALNAIQNAIEAVGRRGGPGRVEVELRPDVAPKQSGYGRDERMWCLLEVRDDGAGLGKADAGRVFDLGYSTKAHGAGVGLSVAKSVVAGMGGAIQLLNKASEAGVGGVGGDRGCVLRVRFPVLGQAVQYRHSA
jgi:signal transduction histidine kinase